MLKSGIHVAARSSYSVVRNHFIRGTIQPGCFTCYNDHSALHHLRSGQRWWMSLVSARHFSSGMHVIEMRGLDPDSTEEEVVGYFRSLHIKPVNVNLRFDQSGRVAGTCEVEFRSHAEVVVAMRKRNSFIGNRFIRLRLKSSDHNGDETTPEGKDTRIKGDLHNADILGSITKNMLSTGHFVRMKGLPRRVTEQAIFDFFWPVNVRPVSIQYVYDDDSRPTGEVDVEFLTHEEAVAAMSKNNAYFGCQFIELILNSTTPNSGDTPTSAGISDSSCQTAFQNAKI